MRRRYHKRTSNRDKYSVEHTVINTPIISSWPAIENGHQWAINILPPTELEGMRKVKHLTATFANYQSAGDNFPIYYAIVYVPAGYDVNNINLPIAGAANNLYEPNQFVMSSGALDFSGGPLRIRSPIARNLNSGDRIALVLATHVTSTTSLVAEVTYAITLQ